MVRDLDAGEARWRKLGFQLAPRSPQMGATPDGAVMAPWASSNHCVMFARGYLELIGITDPARHNPWAAFLDRFEGAATPVSPCAAAAVVAVADLATTRACLSNAGITPTLSADGTVWVPAVEANGGIIAFKQV